MKGPDLYGDRHSAPSPYLLSAMTSKEPSNSLLVFDTSILLEGN